jgi:hypothetical protein
MPRMRAGCPPPHPVRRRMDGSKAHRLTHATMPIGVWHNRRDHAEEADGNRSRPASCIRLCVLHALAHIRSLVLVIEGMAAVSLFGIGCANDASTRSCAPVPCPAPGWDPATCACRPPASIGGAVADAAVDVQRPPLDAARPPHDGSPRDASDTGAVRDGGLLCRPALARRYDPAHDCYGRIAAIPGLCFRETQPTTTEGTGEMVCLVADDGTRYAAAMGFTECLRGDGWDTENTLGIGQGWVEKGDYGLFEQPIYGVLADGATVTDTACAATVYRGNWSLNYLGTPELEFDSLDSGLDARAYAPECPISAADAGRDQ